MIKCPLCESMGNVLVTDRLTSPYQNRLFHKKDDAKEIEAVPVQMHMCLNCSFVWNSKYDSEMELYIEEYQNNQDASPRFQMYIDETIDYIMSILKYEESDRECAMQIKEKNTYKILEIGCGPDAYFLKRLVERYPECECIGYDPSYHMNEIVPRLTVHSEYFDFNADVKESFDLIVSRHTIEHIENPSGMLKSIVSYVNKQGCIAYIETPDVRWILEKMIWFDFFYEHCSLFSNESMSKAIYQFGGSIREIKTSFDGQYLQTVVTPKDGIARLAQQYYKNDTGLEKNTVIKLEGLMKKGACIAVWGAGAKGNMFCNILDPDCKYVSFVIDSDKKKHNRYIAGSGHKIVSPEVVGRVNVTDIIVMNSAYSSEIRKTVLGITDRSINYYDAENNLELMNNV